MRRKVSAGRRNPRAGRGRSPFNFGFRAQSAARGASGLRTPESPHESSSRMKNGWIRSSLHAATFCCRCNKRLRAAARLVSVKFHRVRRREPKSHGKLRGGGGDLGGGDAGGPLTRRGMGPGGRPSGPPKAAKQARKKAVPRMRHPPAVSKTLFPPQAAEKCHGLDHQCSAIHRNSRCPRPLRRTKQTGTAARRGGGTKNWRAACATRQRTKPS